jgi:hypothetical protein
MQIIAIPTHPPPAVVSFRTATLRFARTRSGTYLAISGEVGHRMRYTVTGYRSEWQAEQCRHVPGRGWVVVDDQAFNTLKAGQHWCEDAARRGGTPAPLPAAARTDGGTHQPR